MWHFVVRLNFLVLTASTFCYCKMDSFNLNINDIMDEKLMPASLFWTQDVTSFQDIPDVPINATSRENSDGDFDEAYSTMGFHRKMMNEYLASNFIVRELLTELAPGQIKFQKRLGIAANEAEIEEAINHRTEKSLPKNSFLFDQGSSAYKNWLSKTTTLDDIYRQFDKPIVLSSNKTKYGYKKRKNNGLNRRQGYDLDDVVDDDDYEEGDVTGFAIQQPMPEIPPNAYASSNIEQAQMQESYPYAFPYPTAGIQNQNPTHMQLPVFGEHPENTFTYETAKHFPSFAFPTGSPSEPHHEGYYPSSHGGGSNEDYGLQDTGSSKEIGLKDIMDIALTTLAFLSFGMFILQVIMCITLNKTNNSLMMLPMESDDGADTDVEEIRRRRRSLPGQRIQQINEISRRVLLSIESVLRAKSDNAKCLHRILCENSSFAREQKDGRKLWFPVWSLGISWLSSRFIPPATSTTPILDSLKAAAFGLGKADCKKIYSACNLTTLFEEEKQNFKQKRSIKKILFKWTI